MYTVAAAGDSKINIYNAKTGGIAYQCTLPGSHRVVSSPVVTGDGFSVVIEEGNSGQYVTQFDFRGQIRSKSFVS